MTGATPDWFGKLTLGISYGNIPFHLMFSCENISFVIRTPVPSLPRNGVVIGGENLRSCNGEHMKYVNGAFTLVNAKQTKSRCSPPITPLFHLVFTDVNTSFVHAVNSPLFPEQQKRFNVGYADK